MLNKKLEKDFLSTKHTKDTKKYNLSTYFRGFRRLIKLFIETLRSQIKNIDIQTISQYSLSNSPYAMRVFFGLCPLMCGKALPFRPFAPRKVEALPHFLPSKVEAQPQLSWETHTERQSLSAHRAAEPQNQSNRVR